MIDEDKAYDQRQYNLMLESIQNYHTENGISMAVADLGTLIRRLDGFHAVLKDPSEHWSQSFQSKVNTLGEVIGMLLYQEKVELDQIGHDIVLDAVGQLAALVESVTDHSQP